MTTATESTPKKTRKKIVFHQTKEQTSRHSRCEFCNGRGPDMMTEIVEDAFGKQYRIPKTHTSCKKSILSLSLDLSL